MGSKSVKFDLVKSTDYYKPHDTIPGNVEGGLKEQVSMQVLPLKHKAEQLIASLDSAISVVTYVFNKKTRNNLTESFENINKTIENIQSTTAELNKIMTSGKINAIVTNIDSLTATFKNNSGQIANVIQNLSQLSDSLSKLKVSPLFDQLSSTVSSLNQIVHKLNTTDGTAGLLINDPKLYNNLSELSRSLDLLLKDIRVNPKRYVHFSAFNFGKDVYITSRPGDDQKKDQIVYKVHLISSLAKLSLESTFFKGLGPIEEIKISDTYNYLAGETSNFEEINNLLDKARGNFPDATLVAFKNGRMIKLEKAIKKQTDE
jgi:phospholipid/cholesterol/gamma-HCH transport system substrate-binding protein